MSSVEEVFGTDIATKYKESLQRKRLKILEMTEQTKAEIIEAAKTGFSGEGKTPQVNYIKDGLVYHIILAQTFPDMEIREYKYSKGTAFKYAGNLITAFIKRDADLDKLKADQDYLLVGFLSSRKGTDRSGNQRDYLNFRTDGIITMDEMSAHLKLKEKETGEIKEKIEEHKETE